MGLGGEALGQGSQASKGEASKGLRRDPKGVTGISPFWEALKQGDSAYVARDFDSAITAYRDAITKEPQNAMGHYRLGEAQLAKGDLAEADKSWQAGVRFAGPDHTLKAKLLFLLADLQERKQQYAEALKAWDGYMQFAKQQQAAKSYPASSVERKQRIDQWNKLLSQYADVKKRIEVRLQEAENKARESAK